MGKKENEFLNKIKEDQKRRRSGARMLMDDEVNREVHLQVHPKDQVKEKQSVKQQEQQNVQLKEQEGVSKKVKEQEKGQQQESGQEQEQPQQKEIGQQQVAESVPQQQQQKEKRTVAEVRKELLKKLREKEKEKIPFHERYIKRTDHWDPEVRELFELEAKSYEGGMTALLNDVFKERYGLK